MKISFIIFVCFSLLSISKIISIADESVWRTEEEVMAIYEEWIVKHGKSYNALGEEKFKRFEIFKDNLKYIEKHNSLPNQIYKLGLNQFSDLTFDEFKSIYLSSIPMDTSLSESKIDFSEVDLNFPVPPSVDWREKGALVPIKNQGRCGSCWAFSAVASVEALNKIKGGELISLSEQMMVDCVNASNGCKGGRQTDAFKYIRDHGIASSKDYPYVGVQGPCQPKEIVLKISGYRSIVRNNEKYLQIIASLQVVSISIKVGKDFQHYKSGIFNGTCGDKINHGVNVVGYGSENGIPYWIVRNSWGKGWGEQGYIRMRRNIRDPAGCCGVAITPTFPVIDEGHISIL